MRFSTALLALALAGCTSTTGPASPTSEPGSGLRRTAPCALPTFGPGSAYQPAVDPSQFGPQVDNPWFPLPVSTTYVFAGTEDGARAVDVVSPSRSTRTIDGVRARVVNDRLFLDGVLRETTSDYYAQDRCGNVWYFGEDTAELDGHGRITSREGSWLAGNHGAQPGVYMQAHPERGRAFRQEWLAGSAEDVFRVIDMHTTARVPFGSFGAIRTEETSRLEPGVVDNKLYARGTGEVQELSIKGGADRLSLVDVLT